MTELTLEQAADYVGLSADDLMVTRLRGLPPGNLGHARGGKVYFNQEDLLPVKPSLGCPHCSKSYKTENGLQGHIQAKHGDES